MQADSQFCPMEKGQKQPFSTLNGCLLKNSKFLIKKEYSSDASKKADFF
jgi:hypothetical protein